MCCMMSPVTRLSAEGARLLGHKVANVKSGVAALHDAGEAVTSPDAYVAIALPTQEQVQE